MKGTASSAASSWRGAPGREPESSDSVSRRSRSSAEREATERLREAAADQARALADVGLAGPGGLAKTEADLLAAREAVARARRTFERLGEENRGGSPRSALP